MTENEAIKVLKDEHSYGYELNKACLIAIKALEEIQQYRAIGTVEDIQEVMALCKSLQKTTCKYMDIGTIDEFKALKEDKNFLEFLYNHILPNEMEQYLSMYRIKDKVVVNGYADQCGLMPAT